MNPTPRFTNIKQCIPFGRIYIIREDYHLFPKPHSNIYALSPDGEVIWEAEKVIENDAYSNNMTIIDDLIVVASWNGFTVKLNPNNGKIVESTFTK